MEGGGSLQLFEWLNNCIVDRLQDIIKDGGADNVREIHSVLSVEGIAKSQQKGPQQIHG